MGLVTMGSNPAFMVSSISTFTSLINGEDEKAYPFSGVKIKQVCSVIFLCVHGQQVGWNFLLKLIIKYIYLSS